MGRADLISDLSATWPDRAAGALGNNSLQVRGKNGFSSERMALMIHCEPNPWARCPSVLSGPQVTALAVRRARRSLGPT